MPGAEWPPELLARAEVAGSGEPLWAAADLPDAIEWVASRSLAIYAIEVYGRIDLARGVFRRELEVAPNRDEDETWEQYVTRAAIAAREGLESDLARAEAATADLYFLAAVPPPESWATAGDRPPARGR